MPKHYGNPEHKPAKGGGRFKSGRTGASNLGRSMNTRQGRHKNK